MLMGKEPAKKSCYTQKAHRAVVRTARKSHQVQIRYWAADNQVRNGYILSDEAGTLSVRLVGDLVNHRIAPASRKYVTYHSTLGVYVANVVEAMRVFAEHKARQKARRRQSERDH